MEVYVKQSTRKSQSLNKRMLLAAAITSVFMLSGCTTPSNYQLNSVKSTQEIGYSNAFQEIETMNWPSDQWWRRYQDNQLNQLIQNALEDSPTMRVAEARLKNAQGIAEQIGAIEKIQIGAGATASYTKVSYAYQTANPPVNWNDYGTLTLNFSYDLDFWGKNKASIAAATSDYAASEAEFAASRLMISTSIANAYAEMARLYANQDTVEAALRIRRKTLELLTKRFDNGLETKGAVSQAKSTAASVEAELLGIQESIELQKHALAALVGQGPDRSQSIVRPTVRLSESFGLPKDFGVGLLGHRPDISAARWRAQAAASRIGVARKQFYPDVSISGFIGYQAFGLENVFSSGNDAGSVGPAIYLPIFSGGRLEGQLSSAEATYELAVASYDDTLTQALRRVSDVLTSTKALDSQIEKTQEAVDAAKEAHQIASNRYRGGLASYLDVLTAENALLNSERGLVNLQSRAFNLDLALVHALGGGYQANNSQLN